MLGLSWSGDAADFVDAPGRVAATDPSAHESGPATLLLRQDILEEMLKARGFSLCWMLLGEKQAYLPGPMKRIGEIHVSGACALKDGRLAGFVHFMKDNFGGGEQELAEAIITTKRF